VFAVIIDLYLMETLKKIESSEPVGLAECSEVPFKVRERIRILVSVLVEVTEVQDDTEGTVWLTDKLRRGTEATASRFNDPLLGQLVQCLFQCRILFNTLIARLPIRRRSFT
jgi:hypothetical protein